MIEPGSESAEALAQLAGELRVALGQLVRKLREQGNGSDLTRSQSAVLVRLERDGPATATMLARAEGLRPQSMAKIIAVLEEAGLVGGSPDPKDGRKTFLSLTTSAHEQFRTGRLAKQDWLTQAMAVNLSADEIKQLALAAALLKRLSQSD
jgi:DNA-binding MarR family transcriptional regulator